jgi:hypothetical protein
MYGGTEIMAHTQEVCKGEGHYYYDIINYQTE